MDDETPQLMILSAERIRTVHCGWALPTMQRAAGDDATPVEPRGTQARREKHIPSIR
jgi:hypothetical protein